tara:strand:+ start:150 stop:545 length:396 start_codon:yes stop_codon:yes gene_type:complete
MNKSFGKEDRLKGNKTVSKIFEGQKKSVKIFPFKAFYSISIVKKGTVKYGVSVPKKKFKRAVDRNRIKRLVKEALRLNKSILSQEVFKQNIEIHIMILFNGEKIPNYNFVEIKIKEILTRLALGIQSYEEK